MLFIVCFSCYVFNQCYRSCFSTLVFKHILLFIYIYILINSQFFRFNLMNKSRDNMLSQGRFCTYKCLVVAKVYAYLNRPVAKSCRFVQVRMTFCHHQSLKDESHLQRVFYDKVEYIFLKNRFVIFFMNEFCL